MKVLHKNIIRLHKLQKSKIYFLFSNKNVIYFLILRYFYNKLSFE